VKLSQRLQLCINDLLFIQVDPDYRTDWEDADTSLPDLITRLQILQKSISDYD
jgi:hypothetical protein